MTARLLDFTPDAYHADVDGPSASSSILRTMILRTPAHAKQQHPMLMDGDYKPHHTDAMDEGTALHQLLLGDDRVDVLPYDSFRTAVAQQARDESRDVGRVPYLQHKWDELLVLGESLKRQVAEFPIDPPLFQNGIAEQTIMWHEPAPSGASVASRARPDWLHDDRRYVDDLKKSKSAQPRQWQKAFWSLGYDMQAAFYIRAVRAAFDVEPVFRWVAIEPEPPYAMSVFVLSPQALTAAQAKVGVALDLWAECLRTGVWPAYPALVQTVELPAWLQPVEWDDSALTDVPF